MSNSNKRASVDDVINMLGAPGRDTNAEPASNPAVDNVLKMLGTDEKKEEKKPLLYFNPEAQAATKKKGILGNIKDLFLGDSDKAIDSEARAMFKSMGGLGGIVSTAGADVVNRLQTAKPGSALKFGPNVILNMLASGEGLPAEDWDKALSGDAKDVPTRLKEGGYGPAVQYGVGIPLQAVSDPMNALFSGASALKPRVTPGSFLRQNVENATGPLLPIAKTIRNTGKRAFRTSLQSADSMLNYKDSKKFGEHDYSDLLWDELEKGNFLPRNMTAAELKESLKDMSRETWRGMKDDMSVIPPTDFAPSVSAEAADYGKAAMKQAAKRKYEEAKRKIFKLAEERGIPPNMVFDKLLELRTRLGQAADDPNGIFRGVREGAEDTSRLRDQSEILKRLQSGGPNEQKAAAEYLKKVMPDFADMIDENIVRYNTGQQDIANAFFEKIVKDGFRGERNFEELHQLGVEYGRDAAGSDAFRTNIYKERGKLNQKQVNQAGNKKTIADVIDDRMEKAVDALTPNQGLGAEQVKNFQAKKKRYGILARGNTEAIRQMEKAAKAPFMSKVDWAMLASLNPKLWGVLGVTKYNQLMTRSPKFSMSVGQTLNDLGKTNMWDMMARQGLMNSTDWQESSVPGASVWERMTNGEEK